MADNGSIVINQPSGLGSFTIGDLGVFIGTLGGVITSILIVLQKSHCIKIKFCCWECDRDIAEIERENNPTPPKPKKMKGAEATGESNDEEALVPPKKKKPTPSTLSGSEEEVVGE